VTKDDNGTKREGQGVVNYLFSNDPGAVLWRLNLRWVHGDRGGGEEGTNRDKKNGDVELNPPSSSRGCLEFQGKPTWLGNRDPVNFKLINILLYCIFYFNFSFFILKFPPFFSGTNKSDEKENTQNETGQRWERKISCVVSMVV